MCADKGPSGKGPAVSFLVSHEPMCMQARFLLAKLNPSATHQSDQGLTSEIIFTEDVSLNVSTSNTGHRVCFVASTAKLSTCLLFAMSECLLVAMISCGPDKRPCMNLTVPTSTVTYICCCNAGLYAASMQTCGPDMTQP